MTDRNLTLSLWGVVFGKSIRARLVLIIHDVNIGVLRALNVRDRENDNVEPHLSAGSDTS